MHRAIPALSTLSEPPSVERLKHNPHGRRHISKAGGSYLTLPEFVRTPECNAETDGSFYFSVRSSRWPLSRDLRCVRLPQRPVSHCNRLSFDTCRVWARGRWREESRDQLTIHYRCLLARCVGREASPASPRAWYCLGGRLPMRSSVL